MPGEMSEGNVQGEHVQIPEGTTHCITHAAQPTHGDADAVYPACIQPLQLLWGSPSVNDR